VTRVVAAAVVLMLLPAVLLAAAVGATTGDEDASLMGAADGGAIRLAPPRSKLAFAARRSGSRWQWAWRSPAATPTQGGQTHRPPRARADQWTADHGSSTSAITPSPRPLRVQAHLRRRRDLPDLRGRQRLERVDHLHHRRLPGRAGHSRPRRRHPRCAQRGRRHPVWLRHPWPVRARTRRRLHPPPGHRAVRHHRHRRLRAVLRPHRRLRPLPREAREFGITEGLLAWNSRPLRPTARLSSDSSSQPAADLLVSGRS
jgi:hypothetical protein